MKTTVLAVSLTLSLFAASRADACSLCGSFGGGSYSGTMSDAITLAPGIGLAVASLALDAVVLGYVASGSPPRIGVGVAGWIVGVLGIAFSVLAYTGTTDDHIEPRVAIIGMGAFQALSLGLQTVGLASRTWLVTPAATPGGGGGISLAVRW